MASSKREKELARQRAERQAARRSAAESKRKQRNAVIASVVAVLLIVGVAVGTAIAVRSGDDGQTVAATPTSGPSEAAATPSAGASTAPSTAAADGTTGTCTYEKTTEEASRKVELPPSKEVETKQTFDVTLTTTQGDIVFTMDSAKAPCTANSLRSLAHFAYFDDTPCHRLTTQGIEVLQCGDPSGTGSGGPGYQFADENLTGATYPRGTVAMANAGPGTNGSQFFLVYGDSTLPPQYTPFGTITSGLDVIDKVAKAGSDDSNGVGDGKPKLPIQIKTLRATLQQG